jgi:putative permease
VKQARDLQLRRDLIKLACLIGAAGGILGVFIVTPALSTPTLLSLVATMLISPWVSALERRGYSRVWSIAFIFLLFSILALFFGIWGIRIGMAEWDSFKAQAPDHFHTAIEKMKGFESKIKMEYPFLKTVHPTNSLLIWGEKTGSWFVDHGPALMGSILAWILLIPPLTFVLLNEGRTIRRRIFQLVPNRYFESFFLVTTHILNAISDYIRAKLLEAILVGFLVTAGLAAVGAPYSIVLGLLAGITNIIPYLGPVFGLAPAIFIIGLDPTYSTHTIPVVTVYVIANLVDTVLIFPLVVAKLVNLHPLLLIAVVAMGQEYYGLVGMLISIPIATALKVVLQEIYTAVYESRATRGSFTSPLPDEIDQESSDLGQAD